MRFVCDVCAATAFAGQTVVIGQHEEWVRHLLSPKHQAEQLLQMRRTNYWPEAEWIAMIKALPAYSHDTVELYVSIIMSLSQFGFIEAVYYGDKTKDSTLVAIQLYGFTEMPASLVGPNNEQYEVNLTRRRSIGGAVEKDRTPQRILFRSGAPAPSANALKPAHTANGNSCTDAATCTSPRPLSANAPEHVIKIQANVKKDRVKYDRETLMKFREEKSMPERFSEVLAIRRIIVQPVPEGYGQEMNGFGMHGMQQQENPNIAGFENGIGIHPNNAYQNQFNQRQPYSQARGRGNWRPNNVLTSNNSRWNRNQTEPRKMDDRQHLDIMYEGARDFQ